MTRGPSPVSSVAGVRGALGSRRTSLPRTRGRSPRLTQARGYRLECSRRPGTQWSRERLRAVPGPWSTPEHGGRRHCPRPRSGSGATVGRRCALPTPSFRATHMRAHNTPTCKHGSQGSVARAAPRSPTSLAARQHPPAWQRWAPDSRRTSGPWLAPADPSDAGTGPMHPSPRRTDSPPTPATVGRPRRQVPLWRRARCWLFDCTHSPRGHFGPS